MNDGNLRERVGAAIDRVFGRYFEAPDRNWPGSVHNAIEGVKRELKGAVMAEFDGPVSSENEPAEKAESEDK